MGLGNVCLDFSIRIIDGLHQVLQCIFAFSEIDRDRSIIFVISDFDPHLARADDDIFTFITLTDELMRKSYRIHRQGSPPRFSIPTCIGFQHLRITDIDLGRFPDVSLIQGFGRRLQFLQFHLDRIPGVEFFELLFFSGFHRLQPAFLDFHETLDDFLGIQLRAEPGNRIWIQFRQVSFFLKRRFFPYSAGRICP